MIKENARKLHLNKTEGKSLSMFGMNDKRTKKYLTDQLNELGVDDKDATTWYQKYYKDGKFNDELAKEDDFYTQQYIPAANRFTKEVILNPSVAEANRPLWFSSPAGQLLVQFAGYPTVFNNTVLKRFVNEMDKPEIVAPKILAASMLMTATAVLTNTIRSDAKNFEDLETLKPGELFDSDNFEDNREIVLDAVQRWGGLGIGDYGRRWYENYKIGGGDLGVALKTPTGPLAQDVIDMLLYRKGIGEMAASNLPFVGLTSAIPEDSELGAISFKNIKRKGRELDKSRKEFLAKYILNEQRVNYDKGGLVTDVPQVPQEPDERIDKMTGVPYDEQAGSVMKDEEERVLVNRGGLLNTLQARKQMNSGGLPSDEFNMNNFLEHLKYREGLKDEVYLDTLDKPTGGVGHLLTSEELKKYKVGDKIEQDVIDNWLKEDSEKAVKAARQQAKEYGISSGKFIEALGSVNFQLGVNWENKFPSAVKALKEKNYQEAIKQISTGSAEGGESKWKAQTPTRVEDFVNAINKLEVINTTR
jgi:GH24 family phage-related lysozyme (muramidase)